MKVLSLLAAALLAVTAKDNSVDSQVKSILSGDAARMEAYYYPSSYTASRYWPTSYRDSTYNYTYHTYAAGSYTAGYYQAGVYHPGSYSSAYTPTYYSYSYTYYTPTYYYSYYHLADKTDMTELASAEVISSPQNSFATMGLVSAAVLASTIFLAAKCR